MFFGVPEVPVQGHPVTQIMTTVTMVARARIANVNLDEVIRIRCKTGGQMKRDAPFEGQLNRGRHYGKKTSPVLSGPGCVF